MVDYQKTIMGGAVSKSVKLQVFMSLKTYLELINIVKGKDLSFRTDSQLINYVVSAYLNFKDTTTMLELKNEQCARALSERDAVIILLQEKKKNRGKKKK